MSLVPSWLKGGNDRALAASSYSGQQSATDKAAAKKRAKTLARRQADIRKAARAGQAWEDADRQRFRA